MEKGDYKTVSDLDTEENTEVDTEEDTEEDVDDMDEEWKNVGKELERLSELHSSILKRMENLSIRTAMVEDGFQRGIQECHEESLVDLKKTGEITFGQRLLALLDCTSYKKIENKGQ